MNEPTKVCTRCPERGPQPWSNFHATAKWPDGSMRRPQSRCKLCQRDLRREAYRATASTNQGRKKLRQIWKGKYDVMRADPERWDTRLAYEREYYRTNRSPNPTPERWKDARPIGGLIPCAPVAAAIRDAGLPWREVAERAGLDESVVRRMLSQETTSPERASLILGAIGVLPAEVGL